MNIYMSLLHFFFHWNFIKRTRLNRAKPNTTYNIKHKKKQRPNTEGPATQTSLNRKPKETARRRRSRVTRPRVRSPGDQWTCVLMRTNLLPPEPAKRHDGSPSTASQPEKNRSNRTTITKLEPINRQSRSARSTRR